MTRRDGADSMWQDPTMATRPVRISIEAALLDRIDAAAETRENGRSAFVRSAVQHYLREKERAANDARIRDAYRGKAGEMLAEIADLMDRQAWPSG